MERSTSAPILLFDELDSTNNYAADLIQRSKVQSGTIILTNRQTSGRGQRGASWQSEPGKNITMTYIHQWDSKIEQYWQISASVGVAMHDLLSGMGLDVAVKWPNDLVMRDDLGKLGGILIENRWEGSRLKWVMIGIGLNVNQRSFQVGGASSLVNELELSDEIELKPLVKKLQQGLFHTLQRVESGEFNLEEYERLMVGRDRWLTYSDVKNRQSFRAKVQGVSSDGDLVLLDEHGDRREYRNKEVELIRTP